MSSFNWNDLRFLLATARTASPSQAARTLRVDQTTVRRRLQALETELGVRLLERRGDHHALTAEGRVLLKSAEAVEVLMEHATGEIGGRDRSLSGTVRIGVPDGIGSYFLAPRLIRFQRAHPELTIELVAGSKVFNLSSREADIAILVQRPSQGQHFVRSLGKIANRLYAAPSYLAEHPAPTSLAELADHRFVGFIEEFDFGAQLAAEMRQFGLDGSARFASTSIVAQLKATVAGGGLCLLPRYMAEGSGLWPVLHDQLVAEREIWLVTHADLRDMARVRAVSGFIAEEFARERSYLGGPAAEAPAGRPTIATAGDRRSHSAVGTSA
jgi:DNA-binding transcriptional LysR family regulator